tara:strand:+ start:1124 stop:1921 length:798 start_codon:yes stop_codon:yes gene_type:complete
MKIPYLYFGQKGFLATAGVVNGVYLALTQADHGMEPINKANNVLRPSLRVLHRAGAQVDDVRGSLYTNDFVTGALFNDPDDSDVNQDDKFVGQVTELSAQAKSYTITGNDEKLRILTVSDTAGITATTTDTMYFEQLSHTAEILPINTVTSDICFPATSFIAAEPLAYTDGSGGNAGLYHDGSKLDATRLIFKSVNKAGAAVDTVDLVHTGGKFKEVCEAMQALCNAEVFEEAIKVHHLTAEGQVLHNAFTSRGIAVKRCLITRA